MSRSSQTADDEAAALICQQDDSSEFLVDTSLSAPQLIEKGNELLDRSHNQEALAHYRQAYRISPDVIGGYSMGIAFERCGDRDAAVAAYKAALQFDPRRLEPRVNLGIVLRELGRTDEALHHHLIAYGHAPAHRLTLLNLALTCKAIGRFNEAEYLFKICLVIAPETLEAEANLELPIISRADDGTISGTSAEIAACRIACIFGPASAMAWARLAQAYLDHHAEAAGWDALQIATNLAPNRADFWARFEATSRRLGRAQDALRALEVLCELNPANPTVWNNLGGLLIEQRRYHDACAALETGLRLAPDDAMLMRNLAFAHTALGRPREAYALYKRASQFYPHDSELLLQVVALAQALCEWTDIDTLFAGLAQNLHEDRLAGVGPFPLIAVPGVDAALQLKVAKHFVKSAIGNYPRPAAHRHRRRLRVGYVSGEFREHATSWLLAEIIETHDRAALEIIGFATAGEEGTPTRERLRHAFDEFVDIAALSDEQAYEAIKARDIDILFDLNLFTGTMRLGVFARRPAPIQINYLGFPGTSGAPFIDYIVADNIVIPPELERHYSEKVLRLPHCYQPNDRKRALPAPLTRAEAGLPPTGFVFCSFNAVYKITPDVFDLWCQLLREAPDSVLWILSSDATANANLLREAQKRRVDAARLIFAPRAPLAQHLARFRCADLFLDTFPCTAHTTASDALWCGVPVVTRTGDTFASRVAASILQAAHLPQLVTTDAKSYYALASRLAAQPAELSQLKRHLDDVRYTCPLFDSRAYTRDLEKLLRRAFEEAQIN